MGYQIVDIPERHFLVNEVTIKDHHTSTWKPITDAAFSYLKQFADEAGVALKNETKLYPDDPSDVSLAEVRFWPGYRLADNADIRAIKSKIASTQVRPTSDLAKVDFKVVTLPKQKGAIAFHDAKVDSDGDGKSWGALWAALEGDQDWAMNSQQHLVYSMVRDGDRPEVGYDIVIPVIPKQ
ncbi:hypothetical protein BZG36_00440 [Bifiguratus adelaidae]|uniref:Bacterial transcription activator effector binding domain-containing protein n=1 Tax=Bifiguratus adelaidae TaxID=1938954 RepID=A0A261Y7U0_9FUNG|nr:hypothetical protein BZG36_00440 [Bifiguratus adelaidae]